MFILCEFLKQHPQMRYKISCKCVGKSWLDSIRHSMERMHLAMPVSTHG